MFTILVVCTANVCRSPLASSVLARATGGRFNITNAGTRACDGQEICGEVRTVLSAGPVGRRFAEEHASRGVTQDLIDEADLILVPDLENRSRIAQVLPLARHRCFTLREADLILMAMSQGEFSSSSEFVQFMNARRASVVAGLQPRRPFLRQVEPTLDIADGHVLSAGRHQRTLTDTERVTFRVARNLLRLISQDWSAQSPPFRQV